MGAQLSLKAALPLAESNATVSDRCSNTWPCLNRLSVLIPALHYDDVIMTMLESQITSLTVVYAIVYSGVHQRKHQSSASLAFVREIHRGPVNFPHKWPVTRKMFPFDDVIMWFPVCLALLPYIFVPLALPVVLVIGDGQDWSSPGRRHCQLIL